MREVPYSWLSSFLVSLIWFAKESFLAAAAPHTHQLFFFFLPCVVVVLQSIGGVAWLGLHYMACQRGRVVVEVVLVVGLGFLFLLLLSTSTTIAQLAWKLEKLLSCCNSSSQLDFQTCSNYHFNQNIIKIGFNRGLSKRVFRHITIVTKANQLKV